jgi:hypothetical protein
MRKLSFPLSSIFLDFISLNKYHNLCFFTKLFFYNKYYCSKLKKLINVLRTESLHLTDGSCLINRKHPIILRVVLRQQRGYLFLHIYLFYFNLFNFQNRNQIFWNSILNEILKLLTFHKKIPLFHTVKILLAI